MYQKPRAAKRLYFDVIPRAVDDYLTFLEKYPGRGRRPSGWRIRSGTSMTASRPWAALPLSFGILLNLASVATAEDKAVLWGFISRYVAGRDAARPAPLLDRLVGHAHRLLPRLREADEEVPRAQRAGARGAGGSAAPSSRQLPAGAKRRGRSRTEVYEVGKRHAFAELKAWFKALYEVLLGQARARAWAPSSRSTASPRPSP